MEKMQTTLYRGTRLVTLTLDEHFSYGTEFWKNFSSVVQVYVSTRGYRAKLHVDTLIEEQSFADRYRSMLAKEPETEAARFEPSGDVAISFLQGGALGLQFEEIEAQDWYTHEIDDLVNQPRMSSSSRIGSIVTLIEPFQPDRNWSTDHIIKSKNRYFKPVDDSNMMHVYPHECVNQGKNVIQWSLVGSMKSCLQLSATPKPPDEFIADEDFQYLKHHPQLVSYEHEEWNVCKEHQYVLLSVSNEYGFAHLLYSISFDDDPTVDGSIDDDEEQSPPPNSVAPASSSAGGVVALASSSADGANAPTSSSADGVNAAASSSAGGAVAPASGGANAAASSSVDGAVSPASSFATASSSSGWINKNDQKERYRKWLQNRCDVPYCTRQRGHSGPHNNKKRRNMLW